MYDKQQGKTTYQTYGPLQAATGQYNTAYPRTPNVAANTTPAVGSVNPKVDYYCDIANRVPNTNALGAGNYDGIGDSIGMTVNGIKKAANSVIDYWKSAEEVDTLHYRVRVDSKEDIIVYSTFAALGIIADTAEVIFLYKAAIELAATAPATLGTSVVASMAFLELASSAGMSLVADIISLVKDISTYHKEGEVIVDYSLSDRVKSKLLPIISDYIN